MNIINRIKNATSAFLNQISTPMTIQELISEVHSDGYFVSPDSALRQATVYSCVTLIADNVAQLPLHLFKRTGDGRERAYEHPLYDILKNRPNDWQTPFEFYQFLLTALLLRGMACAYVARVNGRVKFLQPIPPDCISEQWNGHDHWFNVIFADNKSRKVMPSEIFCLKAMSLDGRNAVSPIKCAANTIGLSMTAEQFTRDFYKNGARPSGLLTTQGGLGKEAAQAMSEEWQKNYGQGNRAKTAVLWGGMEYKTISMSNEDAQLLELLNYNRTDIASIFRVPPHMVGAVDKTSSWGSGITEQKNSFISFTLRPWLERIQQAVWRDLLSKSEQKEFYAEFLTDQFLKANQKERAEAYKTALGGTQNPGYMTINEIRKLENLPAIQDGDTIYKPVSSNEKEREIGSEEQTREEQIVS
jgi:HK97 family phage portal protein